MSRRPLAHPVERLAKAQSRMAPGGLLWSESPIPRRYSPRVREAGEDPAPETPTVTLRPVSLVAWRPPQQVDPWTSGLNLVGGAGNNTLRDLSDGTYARMDSSGQTPTTVVSNNFLGSLKATFDTADLGWEPVWAQLTFRARSLVMPIYEDLPAAQLRWNLRSPNEVTTYYSTDMEARVWGPATGWAGMSSNWWRALSGKTVPTAAEVAAGVKLTVQTYTNGIWSTSNPVPPSQADVADVWLVLEGS